MSEPLTREQFNKYCESIFKKRKPRTGPVADIKLLMKHGIPFYVEQDDLVLVSVEGYKKAKALGIVK